MRIWFSGPRILGGLIRPGVSFGPEDFRRRRKAKAGTGTSQSFASGVAFVFFSNFALAAIFTAIVMILTH